MTTTSNLYAEKVFAEHPLVLWALDDFADYESLLPNNKRFISTANGWHISHATVSLPEENEELPEAIPFPDSVMNKVTVDDTKKSCHVITPALFNYSDVNSALGTFAISCYIYAYDQPVVVSIGYEATSESGQPIEVLKSFSVSVENTWAFVSESFALPLNATNIKAKILVDYDVEDEFFFYINGVTVGQSSEVFHSESLGQAVTSISNLPIIAKGIAAQTYGINSTNGYYISHKKMLCATNDAMPLVRGSSSSTRLIRNPDGPSLVVPGYGFMNASGLYKDLTIEMWMRIRSETSEPRKIFGPLTSDDGLYVSDAFLTLRIGKYTGSYFVSEWDRPMLVAIRLSYKKATLIINGEEAISLNTSTEPVTYPNKFSDSGVNQDWLGFYCYTDVPSIELDCIGIYPYLVNNIVQKRRWIFGQGVGLPSDKYGASIDKNVAIDYSVSRYAKNYLYPDIGKFEQGINENLQITPDLITTPNYELPEIIFSNKTIDTWYKEVNYIQDNVFPFITLKPSSYWDNTDGYIHFNSINNISQDIKAFYGFFKPSNITQKQTLFYLKNSISGDYFEIYIENSRVKYVLTTFKSGTSSIILDQPVDVSGGYLSIGMDINKFVNKFGGRLAAFFGGKERLSFYVGGKDSLTNTFSGKIYRIGFCTARNLVKIKDIFSTDNGLMLAASAFEFESSLDGGANPKAIQTETLDAGNNYFGNSSVGFESVQDAGGINTILEERLLDHVASYTLVPKIFIGNFKLDIAVNGYWQDYVPLSYLSKYVIDNNGRKRFSLDYMQLNISYPAKQSFLGGAYDTSGSIIKTYISFNDTRVSPSIAPITNIVPLPSSGVVRPTTNWRTEKYEVVNDTVIYVPKDLEIRRGAITLHLEILSRGIEETPVKIKSIQIASRALDTSAPNPIGTKYGQDIFPYTQLGAYQDYKVDNPVSIFKSSMPHLYLTSTSGIRLREMRPGTVDRYIGVPINKDAYRDYLVSGIQFAVRSTDEEFSTTPQLMFEVKSNSAGGPHIKMYMVSDNASKTRAKVYGVNAKTGLPQDGLTYYVNGHRVRTITLNSMSWATIGISFALPQDFGGRQGELRLSGTALFNNISHFTVSKLDNLSRVSTRKWYAVESRFGTWQFVLQESGPGGLTGNWGDVLFVSVAGYDELGGDTMFKQLTGTDRIVFDTDRTIVLGNYQYKAYSDILWQQETATPV